MPNLQDGLRVTYTRMFEFFYMMRPLPRASEIIHQSPGHGTFIPFLWLVVSSTAHTAATGLEGFAPLGSGARRVFPDGDFVDVHAHVQDRYTVCFSLAHDGPLHSRSAKSSGSRVLESS